MAESVDSLRSKMVQKAIISVRTSEAPLRVLILGCGTGRDIEHVISRYTGPLHVTAVDRSESMLEVARHKADTLPQELISNLTLQFLHSPLETFTPSGDYDLVICSLVLHHMEPTDRHSLYGRICAAMTQDAVFGILQICHVSTRKQNSIWLMHMLPSHRGYPTRKELKAELQQHFSKVSSSSLSHVWLCRK